MKTLDLKVTKEENKITLTITNHPFYETKKDTMIAIYEEEDTEKQIKFLESTLPSIISALLA